MCIKSTKVLSSNCAQKLCRNQYVHCSNRVPITKSTPTWNKFENLLPGMEISQIDVRNKSKQYCYK